MNRFLSDGGKNDANCKKRENTLYSIKSHVNFQYAFAIITLLLFVSFQTGQRLWKGKLQSASFASSKNFFQRKIIVHRYPLQVIMIIVNVRAVQEITTCKITL